MKVDELPCLGKFRAHSCYVWRWVSGGNHYYRECSLLGCSFSETSDTLHPAGQTKIVEEPIKHEHRWTPWESTADQMGSYVPPWLYARRCVCGAKYMAEELER